MAIRSFQVKSAKGQMVDAEYDESTAVKMAAAQIAGRLGLPASESYQLADQYGHVIAPELSIDKSNIVDGQLLSIAPTPSSRKRAGRRRGRKGKTAYAPMPGPLNPTSRSGQILDPVLPFYLLVDTSVSMRDSISQVNEEIENLWRKIRDTPALSDVCYMSIVTFDESARVNIPLQYVRDTHTPPAAFDAVGARTNYECGLDLVAKRINEDVRVLERPYRPVVYFISDGLPNTGDTSAGVARIHDANHFLRGAYPNVVSFGFGAAKPEHMKLVANRQAFMQSSPSARLDEALSWILSSLLQSLGNAAKPAEDANAGIEDIYEGADAAPEGWSQLGAIEK